MTQEQFTYWLQGFFEISDTKELNEKQTQIIKDHLALVFTKVTPNRNLLTEVKIPTTGTVDVDKFPSTFIKDNDNNHLFCKSITQESIKPKCLDEHRTKKVYC